MIRVLIIALVCLPGLFASPVIRDISPHGAQRGRTVTLVVRGDDLPAGAKIESTLPAAFSRLVPRDSMRPNAELAFLVEVKRDTPAGLYPIRLITSDGISNVVLFSVGDLPETSEIETTNPKQLNDSFDKAEAVTPPVVVNGTLTSADVDSYSIQASAGQKLVFEVEARRAGSAIDPAIEIFDAAGHEIAKNDDAPGIGVDARLQVAFTKAGKYFVRVHDSRYSEQSPNFYRLKIGTYSYADAVFPLGWRRGQPVNVTFSGGNLTQPLAVRADMTGKGGLTAVNLPGTAALPMMFALSDAEELLEPERSGAPAMLPADTVMNGRIAKPGEIDRYRVKVEPGQEWFFELTAASLGTSQLDAILTAYDSGGKKLASRDDVNGTDPVLPLKVPPGVHEITIAVEDVLRRGGPGFGYRLQARQQPADFTAELLTTHANIPRGATVQVPVRIYRRGYQGPINVRVTNLPAGFKVSGGHVPPESADQSFNDNNAGYRSARTVLTITASEDASGVYPLDLAAEDPDKRIVRTPVRPGMLVNIRGDRQKPFTAPWLDMPMLIAAAKPLPIGISTPKLRTRIAQGVEFPLEYTIQRKQGVKSAVKVRNSVAGSVGNLRVLKGPPTGSPDRGSYILATNFATPVTTFDMILEAETEIDGKPVTLSSPAIAIDVVPGYTVTLENSSLSTGGENRGTVHRDPSFEGGLVRLQADDLPENVKCGPVEVPAGQERFSMHCSASGPVKPGTYPMRITSVAPNTGHKAKEDYKGPDVETKLVITGATEATR